VSRGRVRHLRGVRPRGGARSPRLGAVRRRTRIGGVHDDLRVPLPLPAAGARPVTHEANYPLGCWDVAGTSDEMGRQLIRRRLLDRDVVLYRRESGAMVALEDRCAHRSLPLSQVRLEGDLLACGYHGVTSDATGSCVRVPSQDNVPYGARVESFEVRERPPFVWIWLGAPAEAGRRAPH